MHGITLSLVKIMGILIRRRRVSPLLAVLPLCLQSFQLSIFFLDHPIQFFLTYRILFLHSFSSCMIHCLFIVPIFFWKFKETDYFLKIL